MADSTITLVGNLVEDPQLRAVGTGTNLTTFRIACTDRRFDRSSEKWVNGPSLFMRVACWRQLAAHVTVSLRRGDRVVVVGKVRQRSYETKDGQRRVAYEIEADAVGAELTWRTIDVRRPRQRVADNVDLATGEVAPDSTTDDREGDLAAGPDSALDGLAGLDEDRADDFDDDLDDSDDRDDRADRADRADRDELDDADLRTDAVADSDLVDVDGVG